MRKLRLSLLLTVLLVSIFATTAFAAPDPANNDGDHNQAFTSSNQEPTNENANTTGLGVDTADNFANVIKNVTGHKTHGEYQNNTNSCASCHQTHTSKGKQLLFGDGVGNTCAACHDGTLGFYNVFQTGAAAGLDGAGTFAGAEGASMHQANDIVNISAAPGGNQDETSGNWGASFNCASCHAPHGSYSDRLLHYNPNGMATFPVTTVGSATYGNQLQDLVPSVTQPAANTYGLVIEDATGYTLSDEPATTAKVVYLYKGATKQTTPWLYGYASHNDPHFTHLAYDHPTHGVGRIEYGDADVKFDNENGLFLALTKKGQEILTGSTTLEGQISMAYVVQMDLQEVDDIDGLKIYKNNQSAYWTEKTLGSEVKDFTGQGVAMSNYCASCHVDYFVASSSKSGIKSGTFTQAYRHTTTKASYTCVRCHFAHGTDANIMMNAEGKTVTELTAVGGQFEGDNVAALDYMRDQNNSSALKKFTNMTVCWACHNSSKATTIKNTNRRDDHPNGMPLTDVDFGGNVVEIQR